jgi:putative tryptophan/tyrosine transport system substrate-binding protein
MKTTQNAPCFDVVRCQRRATGRLMKRREFISFFGSAVATWPLVARAQQRDALRRIGVLMSWDEGDAETKTWLAGFVRGLAELGWTDSGNVRMEVRWAGGDVDRMRVFAKELVDLQSDVILATSTPATGVLHQATRTTPIVFAGISDPVGAGFVASLSHPGGNLTGLINMEASLAGRWVEVLTEIAPGVKRAAIMFNPDTAPGGGSYYLPSFEAAARKLKAEPIAARVRSVAEIEEVITSLGREPGGGLVVMPDSFVETHRAQIILLVARNVVPAVYSLSVFARNGGLLSYGPDRADIFRRSASYVDRILRGAKPAELPVQLPTKFEMIVNGKTAKALGLTIPTTVLSTADQVIE